MYIYTSGNMYVCVCCSMCSFSILSQSAFTLAGSKNVKRFFSNSFEKKNKISTGNIFITLIITYAQIGFCFNGRLCKHLILVSDYKSGSNLKEKYFIEFYLA